MYGMKYIRTHRGIFIFSFDIDHISYCSMTGTKVDDVVSAGFVKVTPYEITCYGRSTTLGKTSLEEDSEVLTRHIFVDD